MGTATVALIGVLVVACGVIGWLAAALRSARRRYRRAVGERGWLLERERESAARAAVDAERARIARELHDIVSHNVSLMIVQAAAAREVLATLPDEAVRALSAVEGAGRDTMTELRHLLGLLAPPADGGAGAPDGDGDGTGGDARSGGGGTGGDGSGGGGGLAGTAGLAPQPSLSRLSPLIDRVAFAGLPVDVRIAGEPWPLPSGIDVTAYRIVQEALTNALRHGASGKAEVMIRYADRSLRVEVLTGGPSVLTAGPSVSPGGPSAVAPTGDARAVALTGGPSAVAGGRGGPVPRGDGAGRGLLGLRERVAVYGGDLDARRRLGGGFRVRARIPVERP